MKNRSCGSSRPALRVAAALLAVPALSLFSMTQAHADVFGRLRLVVQSDTGQPVQGAVVTFHDPTGVRGDVRARTDTQGIAVSPPLENHAWQVTSQLVTFETNTRTLNVAADTTTDVNVALVKHIIRGSRTVAISSGNLTTNASRRDLNFLSRFPATAGNPQSLRNYLATNPGFTQDSVNQSHPRGEHSATSIYLNGFRLPGAFQGRAGQVLIPETIQSADIQTGGYAPEYGGETAAVLNVNLRAGTIKPFQSFSGDTGTYSTYDGSFVFGGQGGSPLAGYEGGGDVPRKFGYLVDINDRSTSNVLEPPQPNNQSTHNHGTSGVFFGNFNYTLGAKDVLTLALSDAPARTQVANRTGLPDKYAPVGEGYGYAGIRNADGTVPGGDPTALGGQTLVLPSQNSAGQDVYQNDENTFGNLNYRHTFGGGLTGLVSYGATRSRLDIRNNNPAVDLGALPVDSPVEFGPTILKKSTDSEFAGSLTQSQGVHTYKLGLLLDKQSGSETYQFIPGSQLALDALYATQASLAPTTGALQVDSAGNPIMDVLNHQVYSLSSGSAAPIAPVHRSGYYNAAFIQDTWRATRKLAVNYGVRYDSYKQDETLLGNTQTIKKDFVGPRLNLAYTVTPQTTFRAAYNRLFIAPPLAQGAIVGAPIIPETLNQYDASVERRLAPNQTVKLAYYYKDMRNQIDTNILIAGTQIGAYSSVNFGIGSAHGTELSYELTPHGAVGLGAYLAYANSVDKPEGYINGDPNAPVPAYNDHDTLNSLSTGLNYTFRGGAFAGLNIYHSSGTQSSKLQSLFFSGTLDNAHRQPHTGVNLSFGTPKVAGYGGLQLDIENVFNSLQPFNFNSGFTGTRFQQGRRVLLRATASF